MIKYKKGIKRALALVLATVTAATSGGFDWATLQVQAAEYVSIYSGAKIKKTYEVKSSGYEYVSKVNFAVQIPSSTGGTVNYTVRVYDNDDELISKGGHVSVDKSGAAINSVDMTGAFYSAAAPELAEITESVVEDVEIVTEEVSDKQLTESADITPTDLEPSTIAHEHVYTYIDNEDGTHTYNCTVEGCEVSETEQCYSDIEGAVLCTKCGAKLPMNEDALVSVEPIEPKNISPDKATTYVNAPVEVSFTESETRVPSGHTITVVATLSFNDCEPLLISGGDASVSEDGSNNYNYSTTMDLTIGPAGAPEIKSVTITEPADDKPLYVDVTEGSKTISFAAEAKDINNRDAIITWSSTGSPDITNTSGNSTSITFPIGANDYTVKAKSGSKEQTRTVYAITTTSVAGGTYSRDASGDKVPVKPTFTINHGAASQTISAPSYTNNLDATAVSGAPATVSYTIGDQVITREFQIAKKTLLKDTDIKQTDFTINPNNDTVTYASTSSEKYKLGEDFTATLKNKRISGSNITYDIEIKGAGSCIADFKFPNVTVSTVGATININDVVTPVVNYSNINKYIYNGSVITPDIDYFDKVTDREITGFGSNVEIQTTAINAGQATAIIKGKGSEGYTGQIELPYTIYKYNLGASYASGKVSVTFDTAKLYGGKPAYSYTGSDITPNVNVTVNGIALPISEYTVNFYNNRNVGTATCEIIGSGNYTGSYTTNFAIVPDLRLSGLVTLTLGSRSKSATIVQSAGEYVAVSGLKREYAGTDIIPTVAVSIDGSPLTLTTDYTVTMPDDTVNAGEKSITIEGQGLYAGQICYATYEITRRDISSAEVTTTVDEFTYNGNQQQPTAASVKVVLDDVELAQGTDYKVEFSTDKDYNTNAGNKTFTVVGMGNYAGEAYGAYVINKLNLSAPGVSISKLNGEDYKADYGTVFTYTGSEIIPEVTLSYGGKTFTTGFKFVRKILDTYKKVGTHDFSVKGDDVNITGSLYGGFTIAEKDMSALRYYVDGIECDKNGSAYDLKTDYSPTYNGTAQSLKNLVIKDGDEILVRDTDYTVSYSSCTNVSDSPKATITGKGNYTGRNVYIEYKISPVNVNETVSGTRIVPTQVDPRYQMIGGLMYPVLEVKDSKKKPDVVMEQGTDYVLVADPKATAAGLNLHCTLEGKGNYTGKREIYYNAGYDISTGMAAITTGSGVGTGTGTAGFKYTVKYGKDFSALPYSVTVDGHLYTTGFDVTTTSRNYGDDVQNSHNNKNIVEVTLTGNSEDLFGSITIPCLIQAGDLEKDVTTTPISLPYTSKEYKSDALKPILASHLKYEFGDIKDSDVLYSPNSVGPGATGTPKPYILVTDNSGNFTASAKVEYEIVIGADDIVLGDISDQYYTGKQIRPTLTVTDKLSGKELKQGIDYYLDYDTNIAIDTPGKVIVHGMGNYLGLTREKTFNIVKVSLSQVTISGLKSHYIYTGSDIDPSGDITVTYNDEVLEEGKDYYVQLDTDKKSVGKHTLRILPIATGIFKDSKTKDYEIWANIEDTRLFEVGVKYPNIKLGAKSATAVPYVKYKSDGSEFKGFTVADETYGFLGDYTVQVDGDNAQFGTGSVQVDVKVQADVNNLHIKANPQKVPYTGTAIQPAFEVYYQEGAGPITSISSNYYTSPVYDNNVNVGTNTAKIKVTMKPGYTSNGTDVEGTFSIYYDIANAVVELSPNEFNYDGNPKVPSVVVKTSSGAPIPADAYTTKFQNNTEAGTATCIITAKDPDGGIKNVDYTIVGEDFSKVVMSIEGGTGNRDYTGDPITPKVTITYGGRTLVEGKDYSVTYTNNVNVSEGGAKVIAQGMGSFSGTKTMSFMISPIPLNSSSVSKQVDPTTFAGQNAYNKPIYALTFNGKALVEGTDFVTPVEHNQQRVAQKTDPNPSTLTFTGKGNFIGSVVVPYTVEAADIAASYMSITKTEAEYTGFPVDPEIEIWCMLGDSLNPVLLKKGTDYTVDYVDLLRSPTEVGEYQIRAIGTGNFKGTNTQTFRITKADLATNDRYEITINPTSVDVTGDGPYVLDSIVVKDKKAPADKQILVENVDYVISYENNTQSGSAADADGPAVIITAVNSTTCNYTGSRRIPFNIGIDISSATVNPITPAHGYTYNGRQQAPTAATAVMPDGTVLKQGTDFEIVPLEAGEGVNRGTVTLSIKGKGKYYGIATGTYEIAPKSINVGTDDDIKIVLDKTVFVYNGNHPYTPGVTVYDTKRAVNKNIPLEEGADKDYTLRWTNNTGIGEATVEVIFNPGGNYAWENGTPASKTFKIVARQLDGSFVVNLFDEANNKYQYYDGGANSFFYPDSETYVDDTTEVKPAVEVYFKETPESDPEMLTLNKDYEIVYEVGGDYCHPGVAKFTIRGLVNYSSTIDVTYLITGSLDDGSSADVVVDESTPFLGSAVEPDVSVKFGSKEYVGLDPEMIDVHYIPDSAGDPTKGSVRVSVAQGTQYPYLRGSRVVDYTLEFNPDSFIFEVDPGEYAYTGATVPVAYKLTAGGRDISFPRNDVTVTKADGSDPEGIKDVGTYKAVLDTVVGGHRITKVAAFKIVAGKIDKDAIVGLPETMFYQGGRDLNPDYSVVNSAGVTLKEDVDYEVVSVDNAGGPGKCIITVTGKGNYSGTATGSFMITPSLVRGLKAVTGSEQGTAAISWDAVQYITGANGNSGYELTVGDMPTMDCTSRSKAIAGLSNGTTYLVKIRAWIKDSHGARVYSDYTSTTFTTGTGKAKAASVSSNAVGQATITFDPYSGATSVYIYRSVDNSTYKLVAVYPKSLYSSYTDKNLKSGAKYYYKLQEAYVVNGSIVKSDMSNAYTVTIR